MPPRRCHRSRDRAPRRPPPNRVAPRPRARPGRARAATPARDRSLGPADPAGTTRRRPTSTRCRSRRPDRCTVRARPRSGRSAPGEPVMRKAHGHGAGQRGRLMLGQPTQLGDGESGQWHAAHRLSPFTRAPRAVAVAQFGDEIAGGRRPSGCRSIATPAARRCRSRPGRPCRAAGRPPPRRQHPARPPAAVSATASACPQARGVDLGAIGWWRDPPHQRAGLRVADDDLARLGRRVDARYERAHMAPPGIALPVPSVPNGARGGAAAVRVPAPWHSHRGRLLRAG